MLAYFKAENTTADFGNQNNKNYILLWLCLGCVHIPHKGKHNIYFSISFLHHISKPNMIPSIDFHCITTWVTCSSG